MSVVPAFDGMEYFPLFLIVFAACMCCVGSVIINAFQNQCYPVDLPCIPRPVVYFLGNLVNFDGSISEVPESKARIVLHRCSSVLSCCPTNALDEEMACQPKESQDVCVNFDISFFGHSEDEVHHILVKNHTECGCKELKIDNDLFSFPKVNPMKGQCPDIHSDGR
ncbi:uncharacterized protein LOC115875235 isoform X1 [Sitophilus oryzae]|uniref:Uncharacterized protein LOC115875235 isoform X1 n=1 Tax=Sitophilus oryzae TaxID=7048 RepID=A0A6J2X5Q4_SITOR|nr:uncharacterized protein LOC115875235 isoform X1 [Sitophilus oryzae]